MNADVLSFRSRQRTRLEIALWLLKQTCWRGVTLTFEHALNTNRPVLVGRLGTAEIRFRYFDDIPAAIAHLNEHLPAAPKRKRARHGPL